MSPSPHAFVGDVYPGFGATRAGLEKEF